RRHGGGDGRDRHRRHRRADLLRRRDRAALRAAAADGHRTTAARGRLTMGAITAFWTELPEWLRFLVVTVFKIAVVLLPLILAVAYFTYWERKIIGWIQNRVGPNRVGWKGVLQPFADVLKMLIKEIVIPTNSNRFLFL